MSKKRAAVFAKHLINTFHLNPVGATIEEGDQIKNDFSIKKSD